MCYEWRSSIYFFPCETGVRQVEKLSLFLLALYLSDLEKCLSENYVNHLEFLNANCIQHICMYLKLLRLLYADDTFILAESAEDLQAALNIFEEIAQNGSSLLMFQKPK